MGPDQTGLTGLRVAYVVSRFPKITETFVLREALALESRGAEVHIFPLVAHGERVTHPEVERFAGRVHRVSVFAPRTIWASLTTLVTRPGRTLAALRATWRGVGGSRAHAARALALLPRVFWLARHMERLGMQHAHAHFATHPALAALVAHELTGIPYSFTAHGSDLHRDPRGLRAKVFGSAFTVTVSEYNRRFIVEHGGDDLDSRLEVIRCGVDLASFSLRAAEPSASPFRVACVAALREVKGHTYLLQALRILVKEGLAVQCELAGDGPLRASLEAEIRTLGLGDCVTLLGSQRGEEIRALLRRSHCVTLTSVLDSEGRREGVPVSLMEAMAAGVPVVASRLSGIPELVEDEVSGLLAEPRDAHGIARALRRLIQDADLRQRLAVAGRVAVETHYDLDRNAASLAARIVAASARSSSFGSTAGTQDAAHGASAPST